MSEEVELVLGIDSSMSCTGFAILTKEIKPKLIAYGKIETIKAKKKENIADDFDLINRYKTIWIGIHKLFQEYNIKHVAIEQPNTFRNGNVTRMLIGLYQVIRFSIFINHNLIAKEINTKTLKKFLTGNGGAEKPQMVKSINKIFKKDFKYHKTDKKKTDDDICDAIGAAYTFIRINK